MVLKFLRNVKDTFLRIREGIKINTEAQAIAKQGPSLLLETILQQLLVEMNYIGGNPDYVISCLATMQGKCREAGLARLLVYVFDNIDNPPLRVVKFHHYPQGEVLGGDGILTVIAMWDGTLGVCQPTGKFRWSPTCKRMNLDWFKKYQPPSVD